MYDEWPARLGGARCLASPCSCRTRQWECAVSGRGPLALVHPEQLDVWILLAMIVIMPFEVNPYLHLSDNFLGVFADFTMIKLLGLIALGWSFVEVMAGRVELGLFQSKQARAFLLFFG